MSELREKACLELAQKLGWNLETVQAVDRAGGTVRFSFPDVIGLIESRLLAEQQSRQARKLIEKMLPACGVGEWTREALKFLAPPAADAQEGS